MRLLVPLHTEPRHMWVLFHQMGTLLSQGTTELGSIAMTDKRRKKLNTPCKFRTKHSVIPYQKGLLILIEKIKV